MLNLIGACDKLFELVFWEESNFISLFFRIWIKLDFSLISSINYLFNTIIKFTCWFTTCHKPLKRGMYHLQIFYTMDQEDHLCVLKTKVVLVLILVELRFFSTQMFDYIRQLFALNFQDSFWAAKVVQLQLRKLLT